jgi:methionyl-tRNA formyltransferase
VPSLDALTGVAEVVGIVCQPDKPAGRGLAMKAPPVKERGMELGLPVVQPTKLRTGEFAEWVRAQRVEVALVVAYGRILPREVLEGPGLGCVNVHASLLPRYRGAAPITWAVVLGEAETGVTLMKLDEGMDTGPTFARVATPIDPDETAGDLSERLALLGADAVRVHLPPYLAGAVTLVPQEDSASTSAPMLRKDDGRIDWSKPAPRVHDHIRGMSPWPGAFTQAHGRTVKVPRARALALTKAGRESRPGEVLIADKSRVIVACGEGCVELLSVQPEGKRAMTGVEWAMGRGVSEGDVLGEETSP